MALITLLLISLSCSKKGGQTSADFKLVLSGISGLTNSAGGAMLWGKSSTGAAFSVNLDSIAGDLELDLKNDTWDFYAITWNSLTGLNIDGVTSCATSKGNILAGGELSIDLSLSNLNCAQTDFSPTNNYVAAEYTFPKLNLSSCKDLSNLTTSVPCAPDPANHNIGHLRSYRVILPEFIEGDAGDFSLSNSPLVSECIIDPGPGLESHLNSADLNLPLGNGSTPFRTIIRGYFDQACGETRGFVDDIYKNGLYAPNEAVLNGNLRTYSYTDSTVEKFFVHHLLTSENACNLASPVVGEFSTGSGTTDDPYGICTPEQFNSVGDDSGLLSSNFELLRDLDFGGYSSGVNDPLGTIACSELGTSIVPFGGLDSTPGCGSPITAPNVFMGNFNGNGHWMRNIFLMEEDLSYLGIFRKVQGNITNLRIENVEIEGAANLGAVTGHAEGATASITNVVAHKGFVAGENSGTPVYVGGLVGQIGMNFTFTNNHALRFEVEGGGDYTGGLVGYSEASISSSSYTGLVETYGNTGSPISYIGGISGKQVGGNITESKSNGAIIALGTNIGGITGYLFDGSSVENSYSLMSIYNGNSASNQNVGGIIGNAGNTTTIDYSYFAGGINSMCGTQDGTCKVGDLGGQAAGLTSTSSFTTAPGGSLGGLYGTTLNYSQFETNSFSGASAMDWSWGTIWQTQVEGSLPRLSWETPELDHCVAPVNFNPISMQIGSGRGSATAPIEICSPTQFRDLKNHSGRHFVISNNINLHEFTDSDQSVNFTNNLDGNGYALHSLFLSVSSENDFGIIKVIAANGSVKNLNLIDSEVESFTGQNVGNLAGTNHGIIDNVNLIASRTIGSTNVGGIVGNNAVGATIKNSKYNFGISLSGSDSIGGIAGFNSGTIEKSISNGYFSIMAATDNLGAVAGYNNTGGIIKEVSSSSTININLDANQIGGIVGNNLGTIDNVINTPYSNIGVNYATISNIGGIAGENQVGGIIRNAIQVGSISGSVISSSVGPIVGNNNSSPGDLIDTYFSNRPHLTSALSTIGILNATSIPPNCIVQTNGDPTGMFAVNDFLVFEKEDRLHEITAISTGDVTIQVGDDECSKIQMSGGDVKEYDFSLGNQVGTYVNSSDMKNIATFCQDTIPVADYNFRCTNGWDIIEDEQFGNGFNYLRDIFRSELLKSPPPTNNPIWVVEEGYDYPSLLFDW